MHVLFVHKNFPAQFGHIAAHLAKREGWQCTFVSELPDAEINGIRRIQYKVKGGATEHTHYCSRAFENFTWHCHGVFEALQAHPEVQPDLIVGHSGFGSTLYLGELYDCPIINYFEWYYHTRGSDMDFRKEFPHKPINDLRAHSRNAMLLADLQNCALGYSPTEWQRSRFPAEYQYKLETIFDGIDTDFWRPLTLEEQGPRRIAGKDIPDDTKIVTYVSRGFESMRGFDIFMKVAARICAERSNVVFVCVGSDRVCYGGDAEHTGGASFKDYVLSSAPHDPNRFIFTGHVPPQELVRLFAMSDLHIYLTVPFILSWSLINALACGCTVLASDTAPVREIIQPGENGLLADFYDVDCFVSLAIKVLTESALHRPLARNGTNTVRDKYNLETCLPRMVNLYKRCLHKKSDSRLPGLD